MIIVDESDPVGGKFIHFFFHLFCGIAVSQAHKRKPNKFESKTLKFYSRIKSSSFVVKTMLNDDDDKYATISNLI